mmetsp:Transcript_123849/g.396473  ORF Transcript_123849/g.396473 Transcript_123849/m.396473 type:complete len:212 (+) Transcript_123849:932-1567(+)
MDCGSLRKACQSTARRLDHTGLLSDWYHSRRYRLPHLSGLRQLARSRLRSDGERLRLPHDAGRPRPYGLPLSAALRRDGHRVGSRYDRRPQPGSPRGTRGRGGGCILRRGRGFLRDLFCSLGQAASHCRSGRCIDLDVENASTSRTVLGSQARRGFSWLLALIRARWIALGRVASVVGGSGTTGIDSAAFHAGGSPWFFADSGLVCRLRDL